MSINYWDLHYSLGCFRSLLYHGIGIFDDSKMMQLFGTVGTSLDDLCLNVEHYQYYLGS